MGKAAHRLLLPLFVQGNHLKRGAYHLMLAIVQLVPRTTGLAFEASDVIKRWDVH